jgi:hypothetical protein
VVARANAAALVRIFDVMIATPFLTAQSRALGRSPNLGKVRRKVVVPRPPFTHSRLREHASVQSTRSSTTSLRYGPLPGVGGVIQAGNGAQMEVQEYWLKGGWPDAELFPAWLPGRKSIDFDRYPARSGNGPNPSAFVRHLQNSEPSYAANQTNRTWSRLSSGCVAARTGTRRPPPQSRRAIPHRDRAAQRGLHTLGQNRRCRPRCCRNLFSPISGTLKLSDQAATSTI